VASSLLPPKLTVDDLSAQEGIYFRGTIPGGFTVTLWEFDHLEKDGGASLFFFSDCLQSLEQPSVVPFTWGEVEKLLRRV
jgi:hypothetical protein